MASNNRSIFDFLFEENGSRQLKEASLSLEFGDDEKEQLGDSYDEIVGILSAAGINVAGGEGDEDDEDMENMEDEDEGEGEGEDEMEEGMHELDEMEEGMYEEDDMEEGMYEEDDMEEGMYEEDDMEEGVYEIDESVLRRELRRLHQIREAAADQAHHFGGGEALGDVILDIDEDDLINVLADELGKYQGVGMPKVGGLKKESRRQQTAQRNGSAQRERQLRESLESARRSALQEKRNANRMKHQLMEMNLFNAKLLYANKLMQNKELTMKQQKAIVEALDNAKTLREAKLLYDSLSESMTRRASGSRNLNEGAVRPVGTASKSTRSAAPANQSGIDSDRWSVLAGLKGN
jgi:hypothetical protein